MFSVHRSFTLSAYYLVLLCSHTQAGGPQALQSSLNFTSFSWRPSSASHLASLGYSEIVGTVEPLAVPTRKPDASITSSWYPTTTPAIAASVAADNGCTIFIGPSVQVYYFPDSTSTTNTKCFTGEAGPPSPMPLGHHNFVSPSVYIVAPAISAGNAYQRVGNAYTSVTFSVAKEDLSTIEGQNQATRQYNFADLPCPPPDVALRDSWFYNPQYNPGRPYQPRISIPSAVWSLDPAWSTCTATAMYQGFDPPTAVDTATVGPDGPGRRFRRGAASPLEPPAYANMPGAAATDVETVTTGPDGPGRRFRRGAAGPLKPPAYVNMPGANAVAPTALPTVRPVNEPDSGPVDLVGRLRRTVEQADLQPGQPQETFKPTKTFVA